MYSRLVVPRNSIQNVSDSRQTKYISQIAQMKEMWKAKYLFTFIRYFPFSVASLRWFSFIVFSLHFSFFFLRGYLESSAASSLHVYGFLKCSQYSSFNHQVFLVHFQGFIWLKFRNTPLWANFVGANSSQTGWNIRNIIFDENGFVQQR